MIKKFMRFLKMNRFERNLAMVRNLYSIFNRNKYGALGSKSYIWKPLFLSGTKYYFIGNAVGIWPNARIEAIDEWEGEKFSPCLRVGDNVMIGQDCHITLANSIEIERDVVISARSVITDISHVTEDKNKAVLKQGIKTKPVKICEGAFVGANVSILPGVTIGKHAIIGAGSVVTKDVPDYCTVVGAPARIIREGN